MRRAKLGGARLPAITIRIGPRTGRRLCGIAAATACAATILSFPSPLAATQPRAAAAGASQADQLARIAQQRYAEEASGVAVHAELRRIASDRGLRAVLARGSPAQLRAYVRQQFQRVWYHQHASRLRIVRGSRTLVDVGVGFVVRPASLTLRDARGRAVGRLDVSIQDIIGYVGYMRRNHHVDIVVRGVGSQHIRSSIPAAATAPLPDRGAATIAGRRYAVRSFGELAYNDEPVKIWVLVGM